MDARATDIGQFKLTIRGRVSPQPNDRESSTSTTLSHGPSSLFFAMLSLSPLAQNSQDFQACTVDRSNRKGFEPRLLADSSSPPVIPYDSIMNISNIPCYPPCFALDSRKIPQRFSDRTDESPREDSSEGNSGEWNLTRFLDESEGGCKKVGGISIFPDIKYFGFPKNRREKGFNQLDGSTLKREREKFRWRFDDRARGMAGGWTMGNVACTR